MSSFGVHKHAHIDAAVLAGLLTLVTYGIKWIFGFQFPDLIFYLPAFIAIFAGFYVILFVVFLIVWSRK
ncbi:MAG: hypothetical protein EG826_03695 [Deltaproteobacteria bacterium]|nr:hypothetical protein [Deltaproteobacteria bacterium]